MSAFESSNRYDFAHHPSLGYFLDPPPIAPNPSNVGDDIRRRAGFFLFTGTLGRTRCRFQTGDDDDDDEYESAARASGAAYKTRLTDKTLIKRLQVMMIIEPFSRDLLLFTPGGPLLSFSEIGLHSCARFYYFTMPCDRPDARLQAGRSRRRGQL